MMVGRAFREASRRGSLTNLASGGLETRPTDLLDIPYQPQFRGDPAHGQDNIIHMLP